MSITLRAYQPADEQSWLRCRLLSFLGTCYYDDVLTRRPKSPAVQLVALHEEVVVGVLDIEIEEQLATIDTIAVHPDHQHRGIASALLDRARAELPASLTTLDAWTREDVAAHAWYRATGFSESEHYLHVYKSGTDPDDGWLSPSHLTSPLTAFCHARLEHEEALRAEFARVYVCRRFSQPLAADGQGE